MNTFKTLLVAAAVMAVAALPAAYDQTRDADELSQFIKETGKEIVLRGKGGGELKIGGDIRMEYKSLAESINGIKERGSGGP